MLERRVPSTPQQRKTPSPPQPQHSVVQAALRRRLSTAQSLNKQYCSPRTGSTDNRLRKQRSGFRSHIPRFSSSFVCRKNCRHWSSVPWHQPQRRTGQVHPSHRTLRLRRTSGCSSTAEVASCSWHHEQQPSDLLLALAHRERQRRNEPGRPVLRGAQAFDNDDPNRYLGRTPLDHTNELSFGGSLGIKYGLNLAMIGHFYSAAAASLVLDTTAGNTGQIFQTDVDGDGTIGDLVPGTIPGSYEHGVKGAGLTG